MARRPNAYAQLIQESRKEYMPENSTIEDNNIVKQQNGEMRQSGNTVENRKTVKNSKTVKITIYPSQEQLDKLYEFMEAYRKRTGMKINQQDLIRRMIDVADITVILP